MVDLNEYGCKGCVCFKAESAADGVHYGEWMPNAGCRFHGLLAEYQAPRADTGVYKVDLGKYENGGFLTPGSGWVDSQGRDAMQGPECPPGVHSLFDPCPGGCLNDEDEPLLTTFEALGPEGLATAPNTTEKERGVLATVRRWWNGLRWPYRWR